MTAIRSIPVITLLAVAPLSGHAIAPINGGMLSVTPVVVNKDPGDQTDPHVSANLVSYTDIATSTIHLYDFNTALDQPIPSVAGDIDILSDVSQGRVAFTRIELHQNDIMVFDTTTKSLTEVDPHPGTNRIGAAIGGNTVAYIDLSANNGDLYAYDLGSSTLTAISTSPGYDQNPNVSPDGSIVVWELCPKITDNCDVMKAVRNGGGWTTSPVANSPDPEGNPDTDGTTIVYNAALTGSATGQDIYFVPVAGGAPVQLPLPGTQQNPSIRSGIIAFESSPDDTAPSDIFIYVISTNTLYQVTNTPDVDELLSDIDVLPNGQVRLTWAADDGPDGEQNIYAATFTIPTCFQFTLDASITVPKPVLSTHAGPAPTYQIAQLHPNPALTFALPAALPVTAGNSGNGLAELIMTNTVTRKAMICSYRGAHGGSEYALSGCVPSTTAGALVSATYIELGLASSGTSGKTEVVVPLQGASCTSSDVTWVTWDQSSFTGVSTTGTVLGSATGSFSDGISVTYSGDLAMSAFVPNWSWTPASSFSGGSVDNNPPTANGEITESGGSYTETITFSVPVHNPVLAIASLGNSGVPASLVFPSTEPFSIQAGGTQNNLGGSSIALCPGSTTSVCGAEASGIIQFEGDYTQLTWTNPTTEYYDVITVGYHADP